MSNFSLSLSAPNWDHLETPQRLSVQGAVYLDGKRVASAQLLQLLDAAAATDELIAALQRLNGFYSWVYQDGERLFAAVDHVRSRPLFYGQAGDEFYLSDDAEWVRQQLGEIEMDPVAREEFLLTGYVTGQETLFKNLKQIQAGELIIIELSNNELTVKTHRHYLFTHEEPHQADTPALYKELDRAAVTCMQRLIDYAAGRQIVIPLSGGYDSRIIATLLKQLGYDNILTFTYGVPGNKESEYSKRTADALGLDWHFVEYSAELWRQAWQTEECLQYRKSASAWSSLAHVQDWLAVKIMRSQGVLKEDCVFVPGHTGDFIAGGHIPENARVGAAANTLEMLDSIFLKHYSISPLTLVSTRKISYWHERIFDRAEHKEVSDGVDFADAFEKWEWQERQAKFICNSVRVYEFFGYDWWMPLWDKDFAEYWAQAPLELRKERSLYLEYVNKKFNSQSINGPSVIGNAADGSNFQSSLRKTLKGHPLIFAKKIRSILMDIGILNKTPLSEQSHFLLSWVPSKEIIELEKSKATVIGAYAKLFAHELIESIIPGKNK